VGPKGGGGGGGGGGSGRSGFKGKQTAPADTCSRSLLACLLAARGWTRRAMSKQTKLIPAPACKPKLATNWPSQVTRRSLLGRPLLCARSLAQVRSWPQLKRVARPAEFARERTINYPFVCTSFVAAGHLLSGRRARAKWAAASGAVSQRRRRRRRRRRPHNEPLQLALHENCAPLGLIGG